MTRDQFFDHLDAMGVERHLVALDQPSVQDAFNLFYSRGKWFVHWSEPGRGPQLEKSFDDESEALADLLARLSPNQADRT